MAGVTEVAVILTWITVLVLGCTAVILKGLQTFEAILDEDHRDRTDTL